MTKTARITWAAASARRLERQFLAMSVGTGTPVPDVVAAMPGAPFQVLSAAEPSVGMRAEGVTRADVRTAPWPAGAPASLMKTHGPRGMRAGNFPVLPVDGVVAGVRHQRNSRDGAPRSRWNRWGVRRRGWQRREPAAQADRVGDALEAEAELVVGEGTVGAHA
ncbi:hypothetical protein [Streptomyces solaniscabiei]|uniref:hypothetical protein n=1 Tax=Streptomyces solaniscabiei TaxID=2683255 RepID=UPI001CE35E35|nr:hypothetical protein [Streptomyces solaniscabiei]